VNFKDADGARFADVDFHWDAVKHAVRRNGLLPFGCDGPDAEGIIRRGWADRKNSVREPGAGSQRRKSIPPGRRFPPKSARAGETLALELPMSANPAAPQGAASNWKNR
jgi:hypothetical protein